MDLRLLCFIAIVAAVFINGFTDAPNAIATAVCTRAVTPVKAAVLGGICNFLGVFCMYYVNRSVANTMANLVVIPQGAAQAVVLSALLSIALWGFVAWLFGLPTSESHGLIAGLTGGALAVAFSPETVRFDQWAKVLKGFGISVVFGVVAGYLACAVISGFTKDANRRRAEKGVDRVQLVFLCAMAFLHGAQDGLKFLGAYTYVVGDVGPAIITMVALVMTFGTMLGGFKIIKKVGQDMVRMEKHQGLASDIASSIGLLTASLTGIPMSTSHMKTAAIVGSCAQRSVKKINFGVMGEIFGGWLYTFPICAVLGFGLTKLLMLFA